jgi:dolichol-phosphate mannosyltransferase
LPQALETARLEPPRPALSIIAPCYNEAETLDAFCARMTAVAWAACGANFELLLVNDGSKDATWSLITAQARASANIVGVNLARNHGHQLAVTAGLSLARGERVLIIDADLQDPPELLGEMMRRLDAGCDVVYGRRRARPRESRFKLVTASLFYRLLRRIAEIDIPQDTGDFRLMSRRVVERLNAMPEQDRFLRGMIAWLGGRQEELLYDRDPRHAGVSGYTLSKMIRLAIDGLTSFSTAPLRLAGLLSMLGVGVAFALTIYAVAGFVMGKTVPGWTSLAVIVVFFSTAQLICLSIFGEYLGRIYMQGKHRPLYLVDEIVAYARRGFDDAPEPSE